MKKRTLIALLSFCSFAALGFVGVSSIQAAAETTTEAVPTAETAKEEVSAETITWLENSFVMDYGASVRVGEEVKDANGAGTGTYKNYGIRFSATAEDAQAQTAFANLANSDAITGVLIAPATSLKTIMSETGIADKNAVLTAQTVFEEGLFDFAAAGAAWTNKTIYNLTSTIEDDAIYGAIINLNTTNFLQKYTGVAYVGVPQTYNDDGSIKTYTYYFAKYAATDSDGNAVVDPMTGEATGNDVANNTRCMYYVAQRAIELGDGTASALKTSYIDAFALAHSNVATTQKFKYTVYHHYITGYDTLHAPVYEVKKETRGGLLNESIVVNSNLVLTAEESASGKEETYPYNDFSTAGKNKGVVYAGNMQVLHVYYSEKLIDDSGSTGGSGDSSGEMETPKVSVSEMLSSSEASTKYFDGGLEYVNGQLVSTDGEGVYGGGQTKVVFTAAFLYELQQNGYKSITIGTLYSTTASGGGGFASTSKVKMTGYDGASGTYNTQSKTVDGVSYTYIPSPITIDLAGYPLEYNESEDKYYYKDTTTEVRAISIQPLSTIGGIFGDITLLGRDWVFENLSFA